MNSDTIVLQKQRNFLYQDIQDLMLSSNYPMSEKQRIFVEFKTMLEGINKSAVIVTITDYIYQNEEMDCCRNLEYLLKNYNKKFRKGKTSIRR
ncbi:hypothetical protein [Bacillus sp. OK048]|uniref:hypothetical protein n=1 Tax=Bacillus sp. OK048 TaxID=1882761 RepID=UPI000881AB17|nr:hypothetical protein [Bacillus sp. OK048]SDM42026.1 hypothetical protein SAMN05443253_103249 [Bacillus sp. OK048]